MCKLIEQYSDLYLKVFVCGRGFGSIGKCEGFAGISLEACVRVTSCRKGLKSFRKSGRS